MVGGETTISTIGYIVKCMGMDHQMVDIWCIVFEVLTVFVQGNFFNEFCSVLIDYVL